MQEKLFNQALAALNDASVTTIVLVARPEIGALEEAARTSSELRDLGLANQRLVLNVVFQASQSHDRIGDALDALGKKALAAMPEALCRLPTDHVPLRAVDSVGFPAL
jgi:arsenite-transporting ATPase